MKYSIILSILIFTGVYLLQGQTGYFFVSFKDKAGTPYSLSNPQQFLSQRSIDRRIRQNITIDSLDLPVSPLYLNELAGQGAKIHSISKWLNGAIVIIDSSIVYQNIVLLPFVRQLKYIRPLNPYATKINKWNISKSYNYGSSENQIKMLQGNYLHNKGYKGQDMLIAVLDAGFSGMDTIHFFDSLYVQNRLVLTRDIVDGFNDISVYEKHAHGTMVTSTMAANINGQYVGTAPLANYALIRTEEGDVEYIFEEYTWVIGAELADSIGADLINSSLGYTEFDDVSMNHTWADMNGRVAVSSIGATIAARKGIIVCASAGNSGLSQWRKIGSPADADSILTVGAVNEYGNYALFSSQGYTADGRIKPDVCAQGQNAAVVVPTGEIYVSNGTSFSSPILCGLVACLWQAMPTKSIMEIMDAIRSTANMHNHPDSLMGYGIPNFELAYHILLSIQPNNFNSFYVSNPFPNPTNHFVQFYYSTGKVEHVKVEVIDINGKLLLSNVFENLVNNGIISIDVSSLSQGYYFINIYFNEQIKHCSFVKN